MTQHACARCASIGGKHTVSCLTEMLGSVPVRVRKAMPEEVQAFARKGR